MPGPGAPRPALLRLQASHLLSLGAVSSQLASPENDARSYGSSLVMSHLLRPNNAPTGGL